MGERTLLFVAGHRALDDAAESAIWAQDQILGALATLPKGTTLISGGARGPDTWAKEIAIANGHRIIEFRLDGNRWEQDKNTFRRWTNLIDRQHDDGDKKKWPLLRTRAVINACCKARAEMWDVRVLCLYAPWSPTHGTEFTERLAKEEMLAVESRTCPAELGPADQSIKVSEWILFDTETTGKSPLRHAMIEIAAIRVTSGLSTVLDRFERQIAIFPGAAVEEEAMDVNGFYEPERHALWDNAPPLRRVCEEFSEWLPGQFAFVGHNVNFDERFLQASMRRVQLPPIKASARSIDTMSHAHYLRNQGRIREMKLRSLAECYGVELKEAHRAMADVEVLLEVMRRMQQEEPWCSNGIEYQPPRQYSRPTTAGPR